ncbi:MAG: serine/threonine protein kinase [Alphaproteobacteria bacterium HGW-Alphaproteobacteria-13]|jgi:NAD(P)-dependent dehydrogenase (short-subunit alcohol dehydrogenase family)|nr:MAG: serine/threonine protein kinase [Alphaproteobacteria bacterium HGW-Alphaproteobacteria-13]
MPIISLTGSTIVVVGASRGLGRQYAVDLGAAGANVVLTGRSGDVHSAAAEIRAAGGSACSVQCDIREPQPFVEAALAAFGTIDALIVNAGIVRDRSFAKMTDAEWSDVIDVHLGGSFACAKAVWPVMMDRQKGSILLTTSGAGMHGAFGQANYAAAKGGIIGLAKTLAIEGKRHGIRVNAVAPMALTDMTGSVFTEKMKEVLRADLVSPFILSLLAPASRLSGAVIECGGGWAALMRWQRAAGIVLGDDRAIADTVSIEAALADFTGGFDLPASTADSLGAAIGEARTLYKMP